MTEFSFVTRLPETLLTARLILRAPSQSDVPALARLANNKKIAQMLARLPHPYLPEHAHDFVDNLARRPTEHAFSVLTRDEDFIGVMGIHLPTGELPELGYWIGEPYWGHGYATEAGLALISTSDAAGCAVMQASARTANTASCRVLGKLGFQKTGNQIGTCGLHQSVDITYFTRRTPR